MYVGEGTVGRGLVTRALGALIVALALASVLTIAGPQPTMAQAAKCKHAKSHTRKISTRSARTAMQCMINKTRKHHGLRKLHYNRKLTKAAQKHTRKMKRQHCFSHECPGEGDLIHRLGSYLNLNGTFAYAENIAFSSTGATTPRAIFRGWMRSSGHRANILSHQTRDIGVGVVSKGSQYWTADFGRR